MSITSNTRLYEETYFPAYHKIWKEINPGYTRVESTWDTDLEDSVYNIIGKARSTDRFKRIITTITGADMWGYHVPTMLKKVRVNIKKASNATRKGK
jgi:predicted GNAT superfamily acetyltransferase